MIHPLSEVQSSQIGDKTYVWQYAVILAGAKIGSNCNINCHTFIENDVIIGNNVTVKSGNYIWDGLQIEDDVFIGPNVTFTNDLNPRSKRSVVFEKTIIEKGASIGAGACILAGIKIGKYAMVGMGAIVTKDVPSHGLVYGSPAILKGWVDKEGHKLKQNENGIWLSSSGERFLETNGLIKEVK